MLLGAVVLGGCGLSEQAFSSTGSPPPPRAREGGDASAASTVNNVSVPLAAAWNPVAFQSQQVTALNGSGQITGLAFWNGTTYVLGPFDQGTINAGAGARRGFYVLASAPTNFSYSGTDDGQGNFVNLTAAGYNLVSFCSSTDVPGSSLTASQNGQTVPLGSVVLPQFFELGSGPAVPVDVTAGGLLRPGRAYWVFANTAQGAVRLSFPGSPTPSPSPASPSTLLRIDVTGVQVGVTLAPGQNVQLTATGVFSDGSTRDLTSQVTWTSSNPTSLSITSGGLATTLVPAGGVVITASLSGVTSTTAVFVQPPNQAPAPTTPTPTPTPPILVTSNSGTDSLTVYTLLANGNVAPLRTISGAATGLNNPLNLAVDPTNGEIYVPNYNTNTVTVYAYNATGNAAPLRTIAGGATGLNLPTGVTVDPTNNEFYVCCEGGAFSVRAFSRSANGNVAPLRAITGAPLAFPSQVAVDNTNNEIIVVNPTNRVSAYARTATGAAAPLRSITGAATQMSDARGVVVDTVNNEILVTNRTGNNITVYPRTGDGNIAPSRFLSGVATQILNPWSMAYNASRDEITIGSLNNQVLTFARSATGNTARCAT